MITVLSALRVLPFLLVCVGLGWWVHPGAGLAATGIFVWVDLHKRSDE